MKLGEEKSAEDRRKLTKLHAIVLSAAGFGKLKVGLRKKQNPCWTKKVKEQVVLKKKLWRRCLATDRLMTICKIKYKGSKYRKWLQRTDRSPRKEFGQFMEKSNTKNTKLF